MTIYDLNNVQTSQRRYGGKAGLKLGILLDGENWLIKFPKPTKEYNKVEISYTTSPLSEYLGSHIYNSIGIDVHQTHLGEIDGKIVVACKDFLQNGERLDEFRAIKNDYIKGLEEELTSTNGSGTDLDEIIIIMEKNQLFIKMPELKDRFWDMFIIDAFIGNNDRNNGNWGVIVNENNNTTYCFQYISSSLFALGKLISLPKLKMRKNKRVYDREWNTWFSCERERQDFISGIAEAEEDEREGRIGTLEELIIEFEETYGIELQHYSR